MIIIIKRNTIQKELVLKLVQSMKNHPTADEIYDEVIKKCPTISKATVYRNLNNLADDGVIRRVEVANAPDRYDFTTTEHCHFLCTKCGKIFDCELSKNYEISEKFKKDFEVTGSEIIFKGYCPKCKL
ncbi:MAG: transcriptional repressor [Oscillospiraceae bacterium]